ncbi:MAG TPA: Asp-tRNA(Asn)/Glu-tRNA(Gln) amidotransferase subunit GatB [Nitriliruptorales bacterium]|nr:Asp-tRNA(Asn)/Glu-tRNA(Gln) amidotransferase subunit GatB [Nitriliruptorales bacterium]
MTSSSVATRWETVIGLEVHVELNTASKMFCGCATDFGAPPNTRVCPVCSGQPGALPVTNAAAIESAARLGLALHCDIAERCRFHRKNYFYPDLAKNYQISQYDVPLCSDGWLDVEVEGSSHRVGLERVHMEEDTGKSLHVGATGRLHGAQYSLIDYNRSGIPLLEVVSKPDLRTSEQAQAYLRELQGIVRALGISDARMEEGSLRCDANVSVRRAGEAFGTRCEIKNLNSVRSLGRAIAYEAERQIHVLESAGEIVQETRHWDEERGVTETLRRKEAITDYRYFPDPDLVEVVSARGWVEQLRGTLPELPAVARARLQAAGVSGPQAATIVGGGLLPWYEDAVATGADPATVANWLAGEVTGQLNQRGAEPVDTPVTGAHIGELVRLVHDGTVSTTLAKDVLDAMFDSGDAPRDIVRRRGLEQISDEAELEALVDRVVADNPDVVEKIRGGAERAIGALVGQVMRETRGKANPQLVNQLLTRRLLGR